MNLKTIHNVYFIGIGGIGMSALARYFSVNGKLVAGYDKTPTPITKGLEEIEIEVSFEDEVKNIPISFLYKEKTLVVYTPAVPKNHLQLNYFKDNGYTVLKRAEVLGEITKNTFCLAVAGTHGKTTTSSILGHIMQPEKATSFLGGIAENYDSNLILGEDRISVVEADEFDRSFLKLSPNIACVTSMDADHLDIYGENEFLQQSFRDFASKVSDTLIVAKGLPLKGLTYAVNEEADYKAYNVKIEEGKYVFDVKTPTSEIKNVAFHLPGNHNMMNALAALAIADVYGVSLEKVKKQLGSFKGVQRRFSYKIKTEDVVLIDDYAHHPTEIKAVAQSVREMYPKEKVLAVFQPHLFSRTRDFADDFAKALSLFDEVLLLDIYPARELPIKGVTSSWLLEKITIEAKKLISKEKLSDEIIKSESKIIVMLGAGDIGLLVNKVKNKLEEKYKK
ncbi:UDP-N-acetylmuramate--L-alanine ligase [Tenacibaculum sp. Mcav3-52]|uniref:UDP-N-acetylmuramate--L-alanine ligase n=1 Tax=Tenacibaculum mesophilum TaxID=104268 RepID=A0ABN5T8K6_9FLAO|nr:UDP-N-acetylmuramate--L-alanine ligase [Tenacibaculum mesophilum]MCG7501287.1 UDP-N-acetylmuramate--L-alanine ligase [Tenacibaculum sp. Mcav3-52]AZJ32614.1 UDP-N-acetylmuramate--L-alanine ligase [Tenacibaculum mesophilum]QFS27866.1 UDP-N-acetylmuramate--L-alanine ligase [Tenacibaculum mesophilum]SHG07099.1 UDP-N-acetylmuramate--L-alanine ligase [Tenacibaculum mesophilum]BFF36540.1 UDP-N-acetylmuramate--L-alanine ligase [Tenacibaculum mesophilum]